MSEKNGTPEEVADEPKQIPAVMIGWNEENKGVVLKIDSKQFPNLDFVKHLLLMAIEQVEFNIKHQQMIAMQNAAKQAAQNEALARKVIQGH